MILRNTFALLAALAIAVAACGPGAGPAQRTRIQIVSAPNVFLAALYVADAEGYFEEENLDVEIVEIESGADSVAALVSGNAQYADIGFDDLVGLAQEGEESLIMVHNILSRVTLTLVMHTDVAQRLGVSRDSPLQDRWAALEGLRLGITSPGAPTDKYMRYYLRQAGLDPDRDADIIAIGGGASLLAALESEQIDAYHLSPPTPYVAEDSGFGTILIDGPSGDVPEFSDFLYTAWAANRAWAEGNAAAAGAFSRALQKGMQKVIEDPDAAAATVAEYIGSDNVALTTRVLRAFLPALSEDGCFTAEAVADSLDTMLEAEIIETAADPAEGVLWTARYNDC